MTHEKHTAHIESLTAQVRVLMVGNRQITLSVAKQLDWVPLDQLTVFGRVRLSNDVQEQVIGATQDGTLALSDIGGYELNHTGRIIQIQGDSISDPAIDEASVIVCRAAPTKILGGIDDAWMKAVVVRLDDLRIAFNVEKIFTGSDSTITRCDDKSHGSVMSDARCEDLVRFKDEETREAVLAHIRVKASAMGDARRRVKAARSAPLIVLAGLR